MDRRRIGFFAALATAFLAGALVVALAGERVTEPAGDARAAVAGLLFGEDEDEDEAPPPAPVALAPVERDTARETFRAVGEILARRGVAVTPPSAGIVAELRVGSGAIVEAGEVLAVLRREAEEAALAAAESRLFEAEEALARAEALAEDGFATESEIETARAAVGTAQAEQTRAEQALADRFVHAPFAGQIGLVQTEAGAFLSVGDPVATLATTGDLVLRLRVPPDVADGLEPGRPVALLGGGPDAPNREAVVETLSPLADPATRTITVDAGIADPTGLRPGAFATADVVWQERDDALFVPARALVLDGRLAFVFVALEDGTAERREVRLGERRDDAVEVVEGLEPGEIVVVEGQADLEDGAPIVEAGEPALAGADG